MSENDLPYLTYHLLRGEYASTPLAVCYKKSELSGTPYADVTILLKEALRLRCLP